MLNSSGPSKVFDFIEFCLALVLVWFSPAITAPGYNVESVVVFQKVWSRVRHSYPLGSWNWTYLVMFGYYCFSCFLFFSFSLCSPAPTSQQSLMLRVVYVSALFRWSTRPRYNTNLKVQPQVSKCIRFNHDLITQIHRYSSFFLWRQVKHSKLDEAIQLSIAVINGC